MRRETSLKSTPHLDRSNDALSPTIRVQMREKLIRCMDLALDVMLRGLEGEKVTGAQLALCRVIIPYAPRIEHGAAPVTLVFPAIPRPEAPRAEIPRTEPTYLEPGEGVGASAIVALDGDNRASGELTEAIGPLSPLRANKHA